MLGLSCYVTHAYTHLRSGRLECVSERWLTEAARGGRCAETRKGQEAEVECQWSCRWADERHGDGSAVGRTGHNNRRPRRTERERLVHQRVDDDGLWRQVGRSWRPLLRDTAATVD